MNILVNITCFVLGFILNTLIRKLIMFVYGEKEKIKYAQEIINKEQKRLEFKEKYDFADTFDNEEKNK